MPKLQRWVAKGPPPISEYRLTFGKHKGKLLEEAPDTYIVKYLIPWQESRYKSMPHCPLLEDALADFREKHPDAANQAEKVKTKPL